MKYYLTRYAATAGILSFEGRLVPATETEPARIERLNAPDGAIKFFEVSEAFDALPAATRDAKKRILKQIDSIESRLKRLRKKSQTLNRVTPMDGTAS